MKIALDGPAGAGKSTVAKAIAQTMGIYYLDTGAMYRAVAYAFISKGIDVNNHSAVLDELPGITIDIEYLGSVQHIFVNCQDVTEQIRTPEISKGASDVAVIPAVRIKLVELQRQVANRYDIVMDGRDIGTYVLPDADFKFYITASTSIRAQRRYLEIHGNHPEITVEQIEKDIIARDATDSNREFAPLRKADDAILVDTTDSSIEEVVAQILGAIAAK